jgi:3-dehydroquinate dehydratase type I
MKICIPIMAGSSDEALAKMEAAFAVADMVELRVDRIRNADLGRLLTGRAKDIIVTNRRIEEGGGFAGKEDERVMPLREAVSLGAGFVDIEAATAPFLIRDLAGRIEKCGGRTRLMISHHGMAGTPGEKSLRKKVMECSALGADIIKIATAAGTMEDNLKVLSLIPYARKKGFEIIAFCMGKAGRMSRVMAPLLGSFLTFASLTAGEESAPGQFTAEEMKKILKQFPVSGY